MSKSLPQKPWDSFLSCSRLVKVILHFLSVPTRVTLSIICPFPPYSVVSKVPCHKVSLSYTSKFLPGSWKYCNLCPGRCEDRNSSPVVFLFLFFDSFVKFIVFLKNYFIIVQLLLSAFTSHQGPPPQPSGLYRYMGYLKGTGTSYRRIDCLTKLHSAHL